MYFCNSGHFFYQMGENSNGQQKADNKPQPRGRWARRIDSGEDLTQLEIADSREGKCIESELERASFHT